MVAASIQSFTVIDVGLRGVGVGDRIGEDITETTADRVVEVVVMAVRDRKNIMYQGCPGGMPGYVYTHVCMKHNHKQTQRMI